MATITYHKELPKLVRRYIAEVNEAEQNRDHFHSWALENQGEDNIVKSAKTRYGVEMGALARAEDDLPEWVGKAKNTGKSNPKSTASASSASSTTAPDNRTQQMLQMFAAVSGESVQALQTQLEEFLSGDKAFAAKKEARIAAENAEKEEYTSALWRFMGNKAKTHAGNSTE